MLGVRRRGRLVIPLDTACTRTELREPAATFVTVEVRRHSHNHCRAWIKAWWPGRVTPETTVYGYIRCWADGTWSAVRDDSPIAARHYEHAVPLDWEEVPMPVRDHVEHAVSEIEA